MEYMSRVTIINIVIVILCVTGIYINNFYEDYKVIGIGCLMLMAVLAIFKESIVKNKEWLAALGSVGRFVIYMGVSILRAVVFVILVITLIIKVLREIGGDT